MLAGVKRFAHCAAFVLLAVALPLSAPGQAGGGVSGPWVMEQSGVTAGLRGIHAVSAEVAWAERDGRNDSADGGWRRYVDAVRCASGCGEAGLSGHLGFGMRRRRLRCRAGLGMRRDCTRR
jgi:hypothetical protein